MLVCVCGTKEKCAQIYNSLLCPLTHCRFTGSPDHPQYVQPPVIPGHEFIGEVVKIGKGEVFTALMVGMGYW